jgi:sterol desaturase/sphingolipid hydroxylase (fatty acid hydroxylase superfamily)
MEQYWWEQAMVIISVPVYTVTILAEILASVYLKRELYTTKDTLNNFLMTSLNILLDTAMRGAFLLLMSWSFPNRFISWNEHGVLYWVAAIVLTDLVYWFVHWMSHMVRFFWAVHTVHHSSEKYNITVGFRSSVFEPLYRFLFFIPLGFIGFEAADIVLAFSIQQLYGSIIHTELIRRIPVWDWIFVSPSHHAVHHASNPRYLDKNMGMILIVWDKIFGTFEPEDEKYDKIKYGLTTNLNTYNPGNILFNEWRQMWHDVKSAPGIREKFMYVFGPPGWSHDGSRKTSHQLRFEEEQS